MKFRDLDSKTQLGGVLFKHPRTGETCEYVSQWMKGVWWKKPEDPAHGHTIYPIFVKDLTEILEWELTEKQNRQLSAKAAAVS